MKVYLAYWCNNEQYDDYNETVDGVFSTRDKAIAFIEGNGYRPTTDEWYVKRGRERWDKRIDEYDTYSMWIREMEVDSCETS